VQKPGELQHRGAGFHRVFATVHISSILSGERVCKPLSGGTHDQFMEQCPTYRAGFALDITLGIYMASAKDNEKKFLELFNIKVRGAVLSEQKTFAIMDEKKRRLSSSVDYYFEHDNRQILVEIDSYNTAKVLVGQYLLINQFRDEALTNPLFLVVHTYKNYEPERTVKYLEHVKDKVLQGKGMPFGVMHINALRSWVGGDTHGFVQLFNA
jgi:hypothetical protein